MDLVDEDMTEDMDFDLGDQGDVEVTIRTFMDLQRNRDLGEYCKPV